MLMRATSEGIQSSINIGYFELNDTPYINPIFLNLERIDPSLRCSISANSFTVFPW